MSQNFKGTIKINPEMYDLVYETTNHFTKPVSTDILKILQEKCPSLYWGGNGVGDRWANKKFNYSLIYSNKKPRLYSNNDEDKIPDDILNEFLQSNKGKCKGIIGVFVHSKKTNIQTRPIRKDIQKQITLLSCVICGTSETICDHKNDLYNDPHVLSLNTQKISDFQPLCNHCNLQKRQMCINETQSNKLYSAKKIQIYKCYPFEFPWEKKAFDKNDIHCKNGTYWFDPVEFSKNIYYYSIYVIPIVNEIKAIARKNEEFT